ncbi:MAG: deaminase [Candidatus Pacearchaeota archaeon]
MTNIVNINRPSWDEFFMLHAFLTSLRSSCKYLRNGAIIAKDKRILAIGYNGAPPGIKNCLDCGCRKEQYKIEFDKKDRGVCRGTHAEMNALNQVSRWDLNKDSNTSIYSVYEPCSQCVKAILAAGIRRVIYAKPYFDNENRDLINELYLEAGMNRYSPNSNGIWIPNEIPQTEGVFRINPASIKRYLKTIGENLENIL